MGKFMSSTDSSKPLELLMMSHLMEILSSQIISSLETMSTEDLEVLRPFSYCFRSKLSILRTLFC